jgi:hypothetical protein
LKPVIYPLLVITYGVPKPRMKCFLSERCFPFKQPARLRRVTAQTMAFTEAREPLIFVNTWNDLAEDGILEPDIDDGYSFFEATRASLSQGLAVTYAPAGSESKSQPYLTS